MKIFGEENYFYHGSIRRYIGLFGSLFTNIVVKRSEDAEYIKVPIKYSNGNRYANVDQGDNREATRISRIVPAMSFTLKTFYKDISRKTNAINRISHSSFDADGKKGFMYNFVPYNFIFELAILTKNIEDMLQIVEQIVPAFDPNITVTIEDIDNTLVDIEKNIAINLQEIDTDDNYDEDNKRMIHYRLTFELKGFLYKRVNKAYVIKEALLLGYFSDFDIEGRAPILIDQIYEQPPIQDEQYSNSSHYKSIEESLFAAVKNVKET